MKGKKPIPDWKSLTPRDHLTINKSMEQKKVIIEQVYPPQFKNAEKMMNNFYKELKRIKRNNLSRKKSEENRKDSIKKPYEAYSASLAGNKQTENQDYVKIMEGIFVICDGHGSNGKEVAKFVGDYAAERCAEKKQLGCLNKFTIS